MRIPVRLWPSQGRDAAAVFLLWVSGLLVVPAALAADEGGRLLQLGDYAGAVAVLRAQQAGRSRSARLERELGIALFTSGDAAGAVTALRAARDLEPRDRATHYFLGSAAEAIGDSALALEAYRGCLAIGGAGLGPVRARVDALFTAQLKRRMAQALATESQLRRADVPMNTLAVPDFALAAGSDSLRPICRGLAALLLADLRRVPELQAVERERLLVLLGQMAEVGGAPAGRGPHIVDRSTAPRLGLLLGARRFVQGTMTSLGPDRVELRALVIDTRAGAQRAAGAPIDGTLAEVLKLEKQLVFQVLDVLGVEVDAKLRRAIQTPATRSFEAFVACSRGLDFEAQGLASRAVAAYGEAVGLDPRFKLAEERLDVLSDSTRRGELDQVLLMEAVEGGRALTARTGIDHQQRSTDALGFGPTTGMLANPGGTTRVDEATRIGTSEPLPGFPGPPKRSPAGAGRPR